MSWKGTAILNCSIAVTDYTSPRDLDGATITSWMREPDGRRYVVLERVVGGETVVTAGRLPAEDLFGDWPPLDPGIERQPKP